MPAQVFPDYLRNLQGESLAKGVEIVRQLGLDKRYGYRVGAALAVAA